MQCIKKYTASGFYLSAPSTAHTIPLPRFIGLVSHRDDLLWNRPLALSTASGPPSSRRKAELGGAPDVLFCIGWRYAPNTRKGWPYGMQPHVV